jgi:hypothetical protein
MHPFPSDPCLQSEFPASVLPPVFGLTVYGSTTVWELRAAVAARSGIPPVRVGLQRCGAWALGVRPELTDADNARTLSELGLLRPSSAATPSSSASSSAAAAGSGATTVGPPTSTLSLTVSLRQGGSMRSLPLLVDPSQVREKGCRGVSASLRPSVL